MVALTFIAPDGTRFEAQGEPGQSLMAAALGAGVPLIEGQCGGFLNCATCHVYLRGPHKDAVPPAGEEEEELLQGTMEPARPESRLSCQVVLTPELDGLEVELPSRQS